MKFFAVALACLAATVSAQSYGSYSSDLSGLSQKSFGLAGKSAGLSGSYAGLSGLSGQSANYGQLLSLQAKPTFISASVPAVASGSYGAGYGLSGAQFGSQYGNARAYSGGVITAAVQSQRNVQVVDVPSTGSVEATSVVIPPTTQALNLEFQSQSSPITVTQSHVPGQAAAPQESSYEEQPDYIRQNIVKPVIHEVTETITPVRRVYQEVKPVQETINQLITQGTGRVAQTGYATAANAGYSANNYAQQQGLALQQVQPSLVGLVQQQQPSAALNYGSYNTGLSALNSNKFVGAFPSNKLASSFSTEKLQQQFSGAAY